MEFVYGEIDERAVLSENAIFYGFNAESNLFNIRLADLCQINDLYEVLNNNLDTISINYTLDLNIIPSYMVLVVPTNICKIVEIYNSIFNITTTWNIARIVLSGKEFWVIQSNNKLAPGSSIIIDFKLEDLILEEEGG